MYNGQSFCVYKKPIHHLICQLLLLLTYLINFYFILLYILIYMWTTCLSLGRWMRRRVRVCMDNLPELGQVDEEEGEGVHGQLA